MLQLPALGGSSLMYRSLAVLLALACSLFGQDTRGSILGRVTDVTGANVSGADVKVSNVATGVSVTAKTNDSGNYVVPYLTPGVYTVTAELAGFKKFIRDNVQVRVNDAVEVNMPLTVGERRRVGGGQGRDA